MNFKPDASLFLRIGLAFVFIYASISAFLDPQSWIGFVPSFVQNTITRGYFLFVHDVVNMGLGLWLLSGKKQFWAAVISCLVLVGIILTNIQSFIIAFRDVGLLLAAVALAIINYKR